MFATLIKMVKASWRFCFVADLSNFIITDIEILQPYTIATKCYDKAEEDADAYHIIVANCTRLAQYGAKVDKDMNGNFAPFTKVSGMPTGLPGILRPAELVGGLNNIGLLMWRSSHPCISSNNEDPGYACCGTKQFDHIPKTEQKIPKTDSRHNLGIDTHPNSDVFVFHESHMRNALKRNKTDCICR